jgi:hypothetical protein
MPSSDMMDISPLPHKAPFVMQIEVQSPTPIPSPAEEVAEESLAPLPSSLEPLKAVGIEYVFDRISIHGSEADMLLQEENCWTTSSISDPD